MQTRNHPSALDARTELVRCGYTTEFSSPERPECWRRPKNKKRFAIGGEQRARSTVFHIVEYPGSPVIDRRDFAWLSV